jgi:hypothetical protein
MNTTAADVQRVAKTYFTPQSRLIIHVMPKAGSSPDAGGQVPEAGGRQ